MAGYHGPCMAFGWGWILPLVMLVFCGVMMVWMWRRMPVGMGMMMRGMPGPGTDKGGLRTAPSDSALEILDKRYALGEMSREEYLEKKADLEGKP